MKKTLLAAMTAVCVLAAGCGDKVSMEKVPLPTETTVSASTGSTDSATAPSGSASAPQSQPAAGAGAPTDAAEDPGYLKTFSVVSCRGTAHVYAMSQEEIDGYIGTTLDYQSAVFLFNGEPVELPENGYTEQAYPAEQFAQDFKTAAADLGITQEEVLSVTLNAEGNIFGNYFYVLDEDTILVYYEGVFFEADSVS